MNHENDRNEGGERLLISVKSLPSVVSLWGSLGPDSFEAEQSWLLKCHERAVYSPDMIYNSLLWQPPTSEIQSFSVNLRWLQIDSYIKTECEAFKGENTISAWSSLSPHMHSLILFSDLLSKNRQINK